MRLSERNEYQWPVTGRCSISKWNTKHFKGEGSTGWTSLVQLEVFWVKPCCAGTIFAQTVNVLCNETNAWGARSTPATGLFETDTAIMALPTADLIQDITTRFILTAPAEQLM